MADFPKQVVIAGLILFYCGTVYSEWCFQLVCSFLVNFKPRSRILNLLGMVVLNTEVTVCNADCSYSEYNNVDFMLQVLVFRRELLCPNEWLLTIISGIQSLIW